MFSRSSVKQTLRLSVAVVSSRLLPMRVSVSTEAGAGLPPVTLPVLSLYVIFIVPRQIALTDKIQLFGGSAAAKEYLYNLSDYNAATWAQNFVASIAGASASLIVSAPLDVVKTRIQNRNFEAKESGFRIVANMAKNEGMSAFFKGLTPKLLMTGPKLVFSFWLAQTLIPAFNKVL